MLTRTLAVAGLKSNRWSFVGIFLLTALTALTLTFDICMYVDLNERQAASLAEVGAGDVWMAESAAKISDALIDDIRDLDEVGDVKVTDGVLASTSYRDAAGHDIENTAAASITYISWDEAPSYNVISSDGASLIPYDESAGPDAGQIYLPVSSQVMNGLHIGDEVVASLGDVERTFEVAAFIEDPQLGSPFIEIKQYVVSGADLESMMRDVEEVGALGDAGSLSSGVFTPGSQTFRKLTLNIFMTDEARAAGLTPAGLAEIIATETDAGELSSGMMSSDTLTGYAMLVVVISTAVFAVFALLLFVIALVICAHTVSTSIEENYADSGVLKALGVPNRMLRRAQMLQYVLACAAGLVVGFAVAFALIPLALPFFSLLTGVLAQLSAPSPLVYLMLATLFGMVVLVVWWKTAALARISPLVAFRSGVGDVHFGSRVSGTISGRMLNLQLAWRAVVSAKRRYIGLLACAFLLSAFVVLTFGIGGSLRTMEDSYDAFGIWMSDLSVTVEDADVTVDEVDEAIREVTPIERRWQENFYMMSMQGESRVVVGLTDFGIVKGVAEGRTPQYDNEVTIGYGLAGSAGVSIGDEFELVGADGKTRTFIVVGLLSAMFNAGYGCMVTYDALGDLKDPGALAVGGATGAVANGGAASPVTAEAAGGAPATENVFGADAGMVDATPAFYQYQLADKDAADEVEALLAARFGDSVDTTPMGIFSSTASMMVIIHDLFIAIGYGMDVIALAIVFLAVSLIIGRMFSAERHDLGIYRALGFTAHKLRLQFGLRFFMVALLGCSLGAAATVAGGSWLVSKLFGMFGVTQFAIDTNPTMVCSLTVGFALVFFVAAYFSARKVRRVQVSMLVSE